MANMSDVKIILAHQVYEYLRLKSPEKWAYVWLLTKDGMKALSYFGDYVAGGFNMPGANDPYMDVVYILDLEMHLVAVRKKGQAMDARTSVLDYSKQTYLSGVHRDFARAARASVSEFLRQLRSWWDRYWHDLHDPLIHRPFASVDGWRL